MCWIYLNGVFNAWWCYFHTGEGGDFQSVWPYATWCAMNVFSFALALFWLDHSVSTSGFMHSGLIFFSFATDTASCFLVSQNIVCVSRCSSHWRSGTLNALPSFLIENMIQPYDTIELIRWQYFPLQILAQAGQSLQGKICLPLPWYQDWVTRVSTLLEWRLLSWQHTFLTWFTDFERWCNRSNLWRQWAQSSEVPWTDNIF